MLSKNLLTFSQSFEKALKQVPDHYDKNDVKVVRDIQVGFFGSQFAFHF